MSNSIHEDFILRPLSAVLLEGIFASASLNIGAETYPLGEYFFQSLFLRMTGAQEQKLKCICWEMATVDYTYRYDFLRRKNYGECSRYSEKNSIYKDLIGQIQKKQPDFSVYQIWDKHIDNIKKKAIINSLIQSIQDLLSTSKIIYWKQYEFDVFCSHWSSFFKSERITPDNNTLMESSLCKFYEDVVYVHRNRCAHNTTSYQINLPTLDTIADKDYSKQNYFYRFALMILLDEIFVRLYKKYISLFEVDKVLD